MWHALPDFIRTDFIWNGPNSALKQSAEKREKKKNQYGNFLANYVDC